jgi:hypothetical protein
LAFDTEDSVNPYKDLMLSMNSGGWETHSQQTYNYITSDAIALLLRYTTNFIVAEITVSSP